VRRGWPSTGRNPMRVTISERCSAFIRSARGRGRAWFLQSRGSREPGGSDTASSRARHCRRRRAVVEQQHRVRAVTLRTIVSAGSWVTVSPRGPFERLPGFTPQPQIPGYIQRSCHAIPHRVRRAAGQRRMSSPASNASLCGRPRLRVTVGRPDSEHGSHLRPTALDLQVGASAVC
jgi:hypothetical protein